MEAGADDRFCIFGAGIFLKHLHALSKEVEGVRTASEDIEYIHRARVASRRLRSAAPLFEHCLPPKKSKTWLKRIKSVTQALGEARDTDVQLDRVKTFRQQQPEKIYHPGIQRLVLRLKQKRERIQPHVEQSMTGLLESGVIKEMTQHMQSLAERQDESSPYTPAMYRHAFHAISSRLVDFLAYDAFVHQPERVAELHEMRIKAKWLRYTIENLAPLYTNGLKAHLKIVKEIQESLGNIHDCDVWSEFLPRFLDEERQRMQDYFGHTRPIKRIIPGVQRFLEDRQENRQRIYEAFVLDWQHWQNDGVWVKLRQTIQAPFFHSAPVESALEEDK